MMRSVISFNQDWRFAKTAEHPDVFPDGWESVDLPHTWNNVDGQDGGNDYWRGTACYVKEFDIPQLPHGGRAILEINGAAMTAEVFLNGVKLARHEGGYATFRVDLTDRLAERNLLCVTVDNSENDSVYPQKADFTFYGGLYRDVNLILVNAAHFELCKDGTPGMKVTPVVDLLDKKASVTLEAWTAGGENVCFSIGNQCVEAAVTDGYARAEIVLENVHLWDGVNDPFLYTAEAVLFSDGRESDRISAQFGCRTFAFDRQKGFLLNGWEYPLRGVSRHQDRAGLGNALTMREHEEDISLIREIGANTVRLAHYQHAQEFYDLCDQYGLIIWAEIPYITHHMPNGRQNTLDQMRELITQCYNHPSVICWGLSNEITAGSQMSEDLMENHRLLNDLCHKMDQTRPTVMAHAFMLEQDSPLIEVADLASYNLYFGWYLGELEQNDSFFDEYHEKYPERVIGFSEYGADANPQFQDEHPEKGDYTEGYQCIYHEHILSCIQARPWMWATHVWNMFDFAADGRDEGGLHGANQKGLVTMDRKLKKDAFYLYKATWNKAEPFVHLCGKRYADRPVDKTEIKVYSNQHIVELFVDGQSIGKQEGDAVFSFHVSISGEHTIEAKAGECVDVMVIRKVNDPNPAYTFRKKGEVINWFDKATFKDDCFSIQDKLGTLLEHPEAGKIVGKLMEDIHSSRGDVAKSTAGNANLQRMLAGMKLESLLKQAGDSISADQIIALNAALQSIHK